jgi:hypothetical protein
VHIRLAKSKALQHLYVSHNVETEIEIDTFSWLSWVTLAAKHNRVWRDFNVNRQANKKYEINELLNDFNLLSSSAQNQQKKNKMLKLTFETICSIDTISTRRSTQRN